MTTGSNKTDGGDLRSLDDRSGHETSTDTTPQQLTALAVLERTAGIQLRNRFIWLVLVLALYILGELSYFQWQSATSSGTPRFETLALMSHLMAVIEGALLIIALLLALGIPAARAAWYSREPRQRFSYVAVGAGGVLVQLLMLGLLIAPLLYLHRYPELVEQGIRIPLMLLQRALIVGCAVLLSYNLILLLRFTLRFPWWLAGTCGAAAHIVLGYSITYLSFSSGVFLRLNDVFYYNQLFPNLQAKDVFHNIQMPYYAYYLGVGAAAVFVVMLLWLPRAIMLSARETPPTASS